VVEGIRAAVVIPAEEVRVHGKNIIEVISDQRLKDVLKVDEGDFVILSIGARDTPN
jgi:CTP-dependent riboflavin kinase